MYISDMKIFKVYYKVPVNGRYAAADSFCHVRAVSKEDAEKQVGDLIEAQLPLLDKLGLIFTSIHEESYTWLSEVLQQFEDLSRLRDELKSAALGGYTAYFHRESRTHIYYVPWLKPMVIRGVGETPHSAHAELKVGVESLIDAADFNNLNHWKKQYQDYWCAEANKED